MQLNFNNPIIKNNLQLRRLNENLFDELIKISSDKRIWKYLPEPFYEPETFKKEWIFKAMQQMKDNTRACYVIFIEDAIVGSSSFYEINAKHKKLSIGYTWFHPHYWGTNANRLTKLAMLEYAFETLHFIRAEFCVDSINHPACLALDKLGIKKEGEVRNHFILSDGRIRHSVKYSVIAEEWFETKRHIEALIAT